MTKSERKAVAETLRRAAEFVDWLRQEDVSLVGACDAIALTFTCTNNYSYSINAFREIIGGTLKYHQYIYWWPLNEAHRPVRVIALLLAADVVESGDWE